MDYLVLLEHGPSSVKVRYGRLGETVPQSAVAWRLSDHRLRGLVLGRLPKALSKYYIGGGYDTRGGALYGLDLPAARDIITTILGPDCEAMGTERNNSRRESSVAVLVAISLAISVGILTFIFSFAKWASLLALIPLGIIFLHRRHL